MRNKVYIKIFLTYLFIFLFPLIIGMITYNEALKVAESETQESSRTSLIRYCETIDNRLEETEKLVNQLSMAASFSDLLNCESPYKDRKTITTILDFQNVLKLYLNTENFITDLYIFFSKPSVVVNHLYSFLSYEDFYGYFFRYSEMNYRQWSEKVLNNGNKRVYYPAAPIYMNEKREDMLLCVQSFPVNSNFKGSIVAMIPVEKIQSIVDNIYVKQYGLFYITDRNNNILFSFNNLPFSNILDESVIKNIDFKNESGSLHKNINGRQLLLSYTISPKNGWRYVTVLPREVVMRKVNSLRNFNSLMIALSTLVGITCILILAYSKSRSIKNLSNILMNKLGVPYSGARQEIDLISQSLSDIISDNLMLKKRMQNQLQMLRNTFIERLLKGNFSSSEEIKQLALQVGLPWEESLKVVVVVKISANSVEGLKNDLIEFNIAKMLVHDALSLYYKSSFYSDIEYDTGVFILETDHKGSGELEVYLGKVVKEVCSLILSKYNIILFFSAGSVFDDFMGTSKSYDEAMEAMNYRILQSDRDIIWYHDIGVRVESYYYPLEVEMHLIHHVKDCNTKMVQSILDRVRSENFSKRSISSGMTKCLINDMYCTLVKIIGILKLEQYGPLEEIESRILKGSRNIGVEENFDFLYEIYFEMCTLISSTRNSNRTTKAMERVVKYIESNYGDQELNMAATADKFGFSAPYLSKVFKEYTGEPFSVYLEQIRINKSCEALLKSDNIEEVAQSVGYNSVNSFRKAFKRIRGMNPSDYRFKERFGLETSGRTMAANNEH